MIAIVNTPSTGPCPPEAISICDLNQLQVARIYAPGTATHNNIVIRVAKYSCGKIGILNLTHSTVYPWLVGEGDLCIVIPLPPGESVTLTAFNPAK